jgi:hypothetical protein
MTLNGAYITDLSDKILLLTPKNLADTVETHVISLVVRDDVTVQLTNSSVNVTHLR